MFPTQLAAHCALSIGGRIEFPATSGMKLVGPVRGVRVTLRGGHSYDCPDSTAIPTRTSSLVASVLAPNTPMPSPCALPRPNASSVPFSYSAANNAGASTVYTGTHNVRAAEAELIGWLLGSESMTTERQSIRYSSADAASLHRVQNLCNKAFPSVNTHWYAKPGGYDITLTAGINNPLKHLVRVLDFYEGCPMAVGRCFSADDLKHFLRGVWGSQGWVYVRKGGNDVACGLGRTHNEYLTSWLRLLHAGIGLQGTREISKNGATRIVFSGFRNYSIFMREIGQFSTSQLPAVPVRRNVPAPATYLANKGETWYDAPVQKVQRLPHPVITYRV